MTPRLNDRGTTRPRGERRKENDQPRPPDFSRVTSEIRPAGESLFEFRVLAVSSQHRYVFLSFFLYPAVRVGVRVGWSSSRRPSHGTIHVRLAYIFIFRNQVQTATDRTLRVRSGFVRVWRAFGIESQDIDNDAAGRRPPRSPYGLYCVDRVVFRILPFGGFSLASCSLWYSPKFHGKLSYQEI